MDSTERAVRENTRAVRTTNAILIAQAMGLDASNPTDIKRALRYLTLAETEVERSEAYE